MRDKDKSYFPKGMVATWPTADEENVDEFDVEVEAEINTKVVRSQLDAVAKTYDTTHQQQGKEPRAAPVAW